MARLADNETVLSLAVSRSNSLRTTVPIHIIRKLGLNPGNHVVWDIDKETSGEWVATIRKKTDAGGNEIEGTNHQVGAGSGQGLV